MEYDKPFKTYREQIDILKNRYGLIIEDEDFAEAALKSLTYYDLVNGYKDCFMEKERFIEGMTIDFIYLFSLVDKGIQSILFKYSTIVENSFKTKLAYVLAENLGVHQDEYLNERCFYKSYNNKLFFSDFKRHCNDIYSGVKPIPQPTKHYMQKHNHIPPWILLKNVSFGNTINLIRLLQASEQQKLIQMLLPDAAIPYNNKVEFTISSLNIIREYRNKIAHNLKFITFKPTRNKLSPTITTKIVSKNLLRWKDINKNKVVVHDIYAYILALDLLLGDNYIRRCFCRELLGLFEATILLEEEVFRAIGMHYFKITGIPENIGVRLTNYMKEITK